jgi:streptomycin 6-kinase
MRGDSEVVTWDAWLAGVPATVERARRRWGIEVGEPFSPGGETAWVAPARSPTLGDVVLKVGWRHAEAEHEADGLRAWDGNGTVRLHAAEAAADSVVLLLERCLPGDTLARRPEPEQDEVIAGLLRRLWIEPPADHPCRPLRQMCDQWADEFEQRVQATASPLDPGLARDGIALFRSLPASAKRTVLLVTDLHAGNVLAARREPWLVVDPKPYIGDPTYDPLQHILNCDRRLHADPRGLALRMADVLDLDGPRLMLWLFARCVQESPGWPGLAEVARRLAPG